MFGKYEWAIVLSKRNIDVYALLVLCILISMRVVVFSTLVLIGIEMTGLLLNVGMKKEGESVGNHRVKVIIKRCLPCKVIGVVRCVYLRYCRKYPDVNGFVFAARAISENYGVTLDNGIDNKRPIAINAMATKYYSQLIDRKQKSKHKL